MKTLSLIIIAIASLSMSAYAQTDTKLGGGYYGNTVTYPGVVFEYEREQMHSEKASLPIRLDLGFYNHPRYNTGIFANLNFGFRRYFNSGLFLEESIGAGFITTFINSEAVYQVDENGNVSEASRYAATDFMPSLTFGIGYNLSKSTESKKLIWVRPQIFWQYPHKTSSMFSPALAVGYTFSL